MGSSNRRLLNQSTHSWVANSTSSRQHQGPVVGEITLHQVGRAGGAVIGHGGLELLASHGALKPHGPHQTLHRAAGHLHALALQLPPDLVRPVNLEIGLPNPANVRTHQRIPPQA